MTTLFSLTHWREKCCLFQNSCDFFFFFAYITFRTWKQS